MFMNFYICSVGVIKSDYIDENLERCISYKGHFMHKTTIHKGAFDDVQENDIIFLKYNNNLIAFGEVNSKSSSENIKLKDWNYAIYVKEWYFHDQTNKGKGVGRYGIQEATLKGDQFATIKQINENYALGKIVEIAGKDNPVFIKIKKIMDNTNNNKMRLNLLTANHNLILTGAPGTGKTYLAKQIAQQMIFGEVKEKMTEDEQKQLNEQCVFVQFHPSYDYTDFVEGLRPKQDDNGNIGFERKNGVFKDFCAKAIAKKTNEENKFEEVWDKLITDIRINLSKGELTKIGGWEYGLSTKDSLKYSSINTPSQYSFTITKKNIWDTYCGRQARPSGAFQKDMLDIVQYLKQTYHLSEKPKLTENDDKTTKPFVFIIDEINRGEISKIFGELFFAIDPGYRGEKGKVKTQYQNLIDDDDEFYDGFYVPENVYIIGTMNDIDRSVESMDFAFRRRFAFKEIKADDRIVMLNDLPQKDKAVRRMQNLNKSIEKIEGLSSSYHIGPAYFLKLKNCNEDFQQLWDNHLEGLLREYLRGMQDVDEKINKLKAAYNNESDPNN